MSQLETIHPPPANVKPLRPSSLDSTILALVCPTKGQSRETELSSKLPCCCLSRCACARSYGNTAQNPASTPQPVFLLTGVPPLEKNAPSMGKGKPRNSDPSPSLAFMIAACSEDLGLFAQVCDKINPISRVTALLGSENPAGNRRQTRGIWPLESATSTQPRQ